MFESLFTPIRIGRLEIRNRIVMAPMATHYADDQGRVSERQIRYYEARASGGVGLIVTESNYVAFEGRGGIRRLGLHDDSVITGHRKLTERVKAFGCRVCAQLHHGGRTVPPHAIGQFPISATANQLMVRGEAFIGTVARKLSTEEIGNIVKAFGDAAKRARETGFDAVQIHAAHGYLIYQFLSPITNNRTDRYGGSEEKRMRLLLEVVDSVRRNVGDELPVMVRLTAEEHLPGGYTLGFVCKLAEKLEQAGVDEISISAGNYEEMEWMVAPVGTPDGYLADAAAEVKKLVKIPIGVVGKIRTPEMADAIIREGKADLVYMGRALLADPMLPVKAQEGRVHDIRYCISCNRGCISRLFNGLDIQCAINPETGQEQEYALTKATKQKRIAVVGGGPAGLEFARVAAARGHFVVLFEKRPWFGGQVVIASKAPYKSDLISLVRFLERDARKNGVILKLNCEVTPENLEVDKFDTVVVATGALPILPEIPGSKLENVVTANEVLSRTVEVGSEAVVLGGGLVGCETAELLVDEGRHVTIVEMLDNLMNGEEFITKKTLLLRLCEKGVHVFVQSTIEAITGTGVIIRSAGKTQFLGADTVVVAVGLKPDRDLLMRLDRANAELLVIGDATEPRNLMEVIHEAANLARWV